MVMHTPMRRTRGHKQREPRTRSIWCVSCNTKYNAKFDRHGRRITPCRTDPKCPLADYSLSDALTVQAYCEKNIRLVYFTIAKYFIRQLPASILRSLGGEEELQAEGMHGLLKAARRYDANDTSGAKFATYAVWSIIAHIRQRLDYWRTNGQLGVPVEEDGVKLVEPVYNLSDLDDQDGRSIEGIERIDHRASEYRTSEDLEYEITDGRGNRRIITQRQLLAAISTLPDRMQNVLIARFWEYKTFKEIGDEEGVSKQRVTQNHNAAIGHLLWKFGFKEIGYKKIVKTWK